MPISAMELAEVIGKRMKGKDYSFPSNKLADLERQGEIIRLKNRQLLCDKLASADIEIVKQDVLPFIYGHDSHELDFWSNDYFLQLANKIIWV